MNHRSALALLGLPALLMACPAEQQKTPEPTKAPGSQPASAPASKPIDGRTPGAIEALMPDADYKEDGPTLPKRPGVKRSFLQLEAQRILRDPVVLKDGKHALVYARIRGQDALWKMPIDGSKPGEIVLPVPRIERKHPLSIHNRQNWYIGIPRIFPDGKHIIFGASMMNPDAEYPNVIGVASVEGGKISAVEAQGVTMARTPDVHPADGDTVMFAACTQIRVGKLKGRGDQVLESTKVLELKRVEGVKQAALCTINRPRYSPDGKQIVFEVIGNHLHKDEVAKYEVPRSKNPGDFVIEIWIANADGTGIRRLVSDEAYAMIGGRIQTGGSREPEFSPDGTRVSFSHGRKVVLVTPDGKKARVVAADTVGDQTSIQYHEEDPTWVDNDTLVSASRLANRDLKIPPGLTVIELAEIPGEP
jgi:hypothetical protein